MRARDIIANELRKLIGKRVKFNREDGETHADVRGILVDSRCVETIYISDGEEVLPLGILSIDYEVIGDIEEDTINTKPVIVGDKSTHTPIDVTTTDSNIILERLQTAFDTLKPNSTINNIHSDIILDGDEYEVIVNNKHAVFAWRKVKDRPIKEKVQAEYNSLNNIHTRNIALSKQVTKLEKALTSTISKLAEADNSYKVNTHLVFKDERIGKACAIADSVTPYQINAILIVRGVEYILCISTTHSRIAKISDVYIVD